MAETLLELDSRPGHKNSHRLTMTTDDLAVDSQRFRWAEIDRISYSARTIIVNGANMGAQFLIGVGTPDRHAYFSLDTSTTGMVRINRHDDQRDLQHAQWAVAVTVLDRMVGDRLVGAMVAAIRGGDAATIVKLRLDRDGVHSTGWFAKSLAWRDIDSLYVLDRYWSIFARGGSQTKALIRISHGVWNGVLLPRVVDAMTDG